MQYKAFQEISLSRLGMGNMRLPVHGDQPNKPIDFEKAQEIIDYAMANGITYYDTAYVYHSGESEKFLGQAMKKYPRESYYIATKFPLIPDKDCKTIFEEQLERLQTDYVDFYLIHGISDRSVQQYIDSGALEYFAEQKKAGRIRYFGFSSHASPEYLKKFADLRQWDFAQLQINYFDWNYSTTKEEYEILAERGIPVMVMEPVRGGRLAQLSPEAEKLLKDAHPDWSLASWAFRWVKRLPQVQVVLSGMSNMEQIMDNVATFSQADALTDQEEALLFKACEVFKKEISVPCTGCRYCCDDCPMQIDIPQFMDIYNKYKTDGFWALRRLESAESQGKPADCIACGACVGHCPQNIQVPDIMKELAEQAEKFKK